jgi:hypothetical protein
MSVTLTFEVAAPLGANLTSADLMPGVLSFSAFDGVRTVDQNDTFQGIDLRVSTDATGNISD